MIGRIRASLIALSLAAALPAPGRALQIDGGDLIGIFIKNGFEVIVNLGPAEPGAIDVSGDVDIPEFGGNLVGAKFVAIGVEDPGKTVNCCGQPTPLPQPNLIYTSSVVDPTPTDAQIALAMEAVDNVSAGSTAWFNILRTLPGTTTEVIAVDEVFSYSLTLGLGTDAVANNLPFSTAATFDQDEKIENFGLYSAVYGYADFGGPETEYLEVGSFSLDGPTGTLEVPEASQVLGTIVGFAALAFGARRRPAV